MRRAGLRVRPSEPAARVQGSPWVLAFKLLQRHTGAVTPISVSTGLSFTVDLGPLTNLPNACARNDGSTYKHFPSPFPSGKGHLSHSEIPSLIIQNMTNEALVFSPEVGS